MESSENLIRRHAGELFKEDSQQISLGDCMVPEIVCELKKNDSELWYHIKRYRYIINSPCRNTDDVFLLVLVMSDPRDFVTRDMYRKTSGSVKDVLGEKIKTVFVVGQTNDSDVERRILAENSVHRDIIKMTFYDTYKNFTLKTLLAMRWAIDYCAGVKFVLRCRHDVIANYREIIRYLKDLPKFKTETLFTGYLYPKGSSPFRILTQKYYQSFRQYSGNKYPAVLSGFATVASFQVISVLHSASFWKHLFIEDVYLATLAHENDIELVHNPNFWLTVPPELKKDSCLLSMPLAIHKAPDFKFWSVLDDFGKTDSSKLQSRTRVA
ncbi:lactosylceramide 1,3-N-acetyl-beta-D-glucosaminyltransferase-like [Lingula anatina]|uniref:Hexosyltransferase n=1 Tax=Lingula anatina TaxID=7574 RepID=A0A1S3HNU3_LINAN|nr:lactosylceramide 1,3-N-acetyl-beta-D-glucosaminyltransferase-like [Lingula anatina]|eukprot:XP_013386704.1 lactosylceramide 1,3-N-acetyl-beta-D-glucosaminyltransferase-like [Lingula anatina]